MDNDDYPPFMRNAMRDSVLRAHRRVVASIKVVYESGRELRAGVS